MNPVRLPLLQPAQRHKSAQRGVVLLEAMVAILLFSMGVLAVVGLQAAMIKNTSDAKYRSEASYIAQQWIGYMWSDPSPLQLPNYLISNTDPRYDISTFIPNGTRTVTQLAPCVAPLNPLNCPYQITITWQQPGNDQLQHSFSTIFTID